MATTLTPFPGIRGTADWITNMRPESWRQTLAILDVNGDLPFTALTNMMESEQVDDPHFHYWVRIRPKQYGDLTGKYSDAALSTSYTSGGTDGSIIYAKMAAAQAKEFKNDHVVMFRKGGSMAAQGSGDPDYDLDVNALVTNVVINGASSYVECKLLEADDNSSVNTLANADTLLIIGTAHREGAPRPDPIAYEPMEMENLTQIFRNSVGETRTAMRTKIRTEAQYQQALAECLWLHGVEMEKTFMYGKYKTTVEGGKKKRYTMGFVPYVKTYAPSDHLLNFITDTDPLIKQKDWASTEAYDWFEKKLGIIFKYGSRRKLAVAGAGALIGINRMARALGVMELTTADDMFGTQITRIVTAVGEIYLKTHPLFSLDPTSYNTLLIGEFEKAKYRYIDDTFFKGDPDNWRKSTETGSDSIEEEYLTEAGLEFPEPELFSYINGVGKTNTVVGI